MKWHFRTIGMGSFNYHSAARRLALEAAATGLFETSLGLNERDLRSINQSFWKDHNNVLNPRVPGFGWWVWKPYFILNALLSIPEGDGLLYLDAGCVIENDLISILKIKEHMSLASTQSVVGSNSDFFPEFMYTSSSLLDYFNLSEQQRRESQYCAAVVFLVNDTRGRAFVREWCRLVCVDDHKWLLPKESNHSNHPDFKHHMHDQATFSCLIKTYGGKSIVTGNRDIDGPIRLARHRYGYKLNESRRYIRLFFHSLSLVNRINLAIQRRIFYRSLTQRPRSHSLKII